MRNISLKQIFILVILFVFFFGDLFNFKKRLYDFFKRFKSYVFKKDKKKGT